MVMVGRAWHSLTAARGCFIHISLSVNGIQPGEVISGYDRVLILFQRFAVILCCDVVVFAGIFKHSDECISGRIIRTNLEDSLVLRYGAVLLLRVNEESTQSRVGW